MKYSSLLLIVVLIAGSKIGTAQPSEPGVFQLAHLFSRADRVALVKVVSGTTEAYDIPIYKAQVEKAFKGAAAGETIYFGPYIATELGSEYILFLRDKSNAIAPKTKADVGYGTVHYSEVFDEGYSSMRTAYLCAFGGPSAKQQCDYGVRVCTDYIKLPKSLPAFPDGDNDPPFGCRWAKKDAFIFVLEELSGKREIGFVAPQIGVLIQ